MKMKKLAFGSAATLLLLSMVGGAMALEPTHDDYALQLLGKYLFFDKISVPSRQSCSSCHTPDAGWTNGTSGINQKQVAVTGANPHTAVGDLKPPRNAGALKPPSNAYAKFAPDLDIDARRGGNFWNGRADGTQVRNLNVLGGTLNRYAQYLGPVADQAHASPFTNPVEQGVANKTDVCEIVKSAKYAPLYPIAYDGAEIDCDGDVVTTFGRFAVALSAYQHSNEVNPFDSRRDRALKKDGEFPLDDFTDQENLGHDLFYNVTSELNPDGKRANCALFCHNSEGFGSNGEEPEQLYTNNGYFNIGTPRNVEIPGNPKPNIGLVATTELEQHRGRHKIPTLRNVDKRRGKGFKKAYTHNGYFKSLESLIHFYNTRDVKDRCEDPGTTEKDALAQNCWPAPGVNVNVTGGGIIGSLGLEPDEEAAIVAYLKTLTDIPTPKAPKPFNLKKF
jgi:cytochrome c peroxidase